MDNPQRSVPPPPSVGSYEPERIKTWRFPFRITLQRTSKVIRIGEVGYGWSEFEVRWCLYWRGDNILWYMKLRQQGELEGDS